MYQYNLTESVYAALKYYGGIYPHYFAYIFYYVTVNPYRVQIL